ncbi:uncharacterized protein LOC107040582 [Diachasma alloeum]|uniref:uncharacterized protein LOC107040582 n=1 Tax=Diachasma alloeum TaxID=454923 RepID=UPI00073840B9|nr:uncharacterized protein LOC107040582 [Diachasma alloeum]
MIPSSATMLKNLEQRAASNFLMENLLQNKTSNGSDFSLTLNWAASLMARKRENEAIISTSEHLLKKPKRDFDRDIDDETLVHADGDLETETEPETDIEITTGYHERLSQLRICKRLKSDEIQENERFIGEDLSRDWMSFNVIENSSKKAIKNDERLANDEACSLSCADDQCQNPLSTTHSFISSAAESRVIQAKEKPELKFGVKAILADDNDKRRNSENPPVLQILPNFNHSLQHSATLQTGYASGIAKPIARPTAYHPHHPPHSTHQPGPPAQHPFSPHAHHTLQLLACRGPYLTVSNPGNGGHLSGSSAVGGSVFPTAIQPGLGDLASLSAACFPWAASTRGRPRKGMMRRAVFSDTQRRGLEKRFQLQKYINKPERKKLAERLGLKDSQVKIWFQNRRMKWRNNKERELMAAGGSREQTLPNKNNPNPDLSDTDNDRSSRLDLNSDVSTLNSLTDLTDNEENEEINVT